MTDNADIPQRDDSQDARPEGAPSLSSHFGAEVAKQCFEVVQRFRAGETSKVAAILDIQKQIPRESGDDNKFVQAFGSYCDMLDNFERYRSRAGERSQTIDDPELSPRREGAAGNEEQQEDVDRTSKRSRSPRDDDDDTHPAKRKIDVNILPWVARDAVDANALSSSLRQTQSALENFSRDVKFAKSSLVNSFNCPQFPDSEWTSLLAGRAVDLDHVLSGLFSISQEQKYKEKVGQLEIAVGLSAPAKSVKTHGEWVTAWDPTVEATTYAFPHRELELKRYGKYILQFFAALPSEHHHRIISFDRAVRIRVAQRRDLLLTDFGEFVDLHMHWIQGTGSGSSARLASGSRSEPGARRTQKREACRRWNENRCPNTTAACSYAHVCSKCRSNSHVAAECKK
jgi:hypothetical protein